MGVAILLTTVAGPVVLAVTGVFVSRRHSHAQGEAVVSSRTPTMPLVVNSSLAYVLAFNITFFIQELFLVLPKALTPGLRPTLFHNNHTWSGNNPVAHLFQGTGALAIFVTGAIFLVVLQFVRLRSPVVMLFVIWMAYNGFMQALAQISWGVLAPGSDVGLAMDYLRWSQSTKTILSLLALLGMIIVPLWLSRSLLAVASGSHDVATARGRNIFVFKAAALAAALGTLVIIPFRIPRSLVEVLFPPILVAILGVSWMQAGAWVMTKVSSKGVAMRGIAWPLVIALFALFAAFHFVLARGVRFF